MEKINQALIFLDSIIGGSQWFVVFLIGTGLFFTVYLRFPQIRYFRRGWAVMRGKHENAQARGDATHFQSLSTALSSTVGTGNVAGVALAIHLGGPAAAFWMAFTAFIGMTTKFVEVTLSHKYREFAEDGTVVGGPMYYMKNRLGLPWMAVIFSVATIFATLGTGVLPQMNNMIGAMKSAFHVPVAPTAILVTLFTGVVILKGLRRIVQVNMILVPFMGLFYILGALSVILYNYDNILPSLASIGQTLFTGTAAAGGFLGASVGYAINRGANRGLFSNEAGQGSSPITHAAARSRDSMSEGMVALLEPFFDTLVVCMLTALAVLSSGTWKEKFNNDFQTADLTILSGVYSDQNASQAHQLYQHIAGKEALPLFSGTLEVTSGRILNPVTLIHARSQAEDVQVTQAGSVFTGTIPVDKGMLRLARADLKIRGRSLVHSSALSTEAFRRGFFGDWGGYIIPITLLLFAYSTAISWSYYGDRAVAFLWGVRYVLYYRLAYIAIFFVAAFVDTTTIWLFSGVTTAFMTLPNLCGLWMLRKEVRGMVYRYDRRGKFLE